MKKIHILICFQVLAFVGIAQQKKNLTLNEIWASPAFRPALVMGFHSMNDGIHYSTMAYTSNGVVIEKYSYATSNKIEDVLKSSDFKLPGGKQLDFDEYTFSMDEKKLLLRTETEQIYRHSSRSTFVVIDLVSKAVVYLSEGKQQHASFSPDGSKVAFVRDNNLFVRDLNSNTEVEITKDGKQNEIIHGAADWVYEEEFTMSQAFEWSPDGNKIAWLRFDEREVKEFNMPLYGTLYPKDYRFKYPKAGEANSVVEVFVFDILSGQTVKMNTGDNPDQYIPRITWTSKSSELCITRLNRLQNHLELLVANSTNGQTRTILEEKSNTYIDVHDHLTFLKDGKRFIWSSEFDGFNRLYLYSIDGKRLNALSPSKIDITKFYGIDEKNSMVYFQTSSPTPSDRSIYVAGLNGKASKKLVSGEGHQSAEFSTSFSYMIVNRSTSKDPYTFDLFDGKGNFLRVLEDNSALKEKLSTYNLSPKTFFTFTTTENVSLNGWMIKPPDFDEKKTYPVLMTVYGGPGHNTVENQWEGPTFLWHQLLAQKGYIIVSVDNRGTGNRGEEFKKCTYKQLGKLETQDQMEAAKYLGSLPYIDSRRIGIQGWSYGGYMSSLCITKGSALFRMAIAVAPVTNWRFYDSIYTERFMQTPQENPSGYDDNSPINHVARLEGKYLLIHGTADDNVHFQNSVEMVNALVKANKQFDLFFYPDKNHGIYGGNTRLHLYTQMTDYILKNL